MAVIREPRAKQPSETGECGGPPAIAIVADDLSSATDCCVQMIMGGYRGVVPLSFEFPIPGGMDVVAFDTDSRNLSSEQAYQATRRCAGSLSLGPGAVLYKSVDSTLRGNLGAEIDALLGTGRFDAAIVAPAFPCRSQKPHPSTDWLSLCPEWHCQTNANWSTKRPEPGLSGRKLTPLGQGDGAVLLEDVAAVEMAVLVEVIVDRGLDGGEFPKGHDVPELRHSPLSSWERLM